MCSFLNVKFELIKNKLIEGIFKNVNEMVITYRNRFLNDVSLFNSTLHISSTIYFFHCESMNKIYGVINFKPLTIEDFLYHSLEELMFNIKICLIEEIKKNRR